MPTLRSVRRGWFTSVGVCVAVLVAAPAAMARNADVYPPDSKPFGKSYGEWSALWWTQAVSDRGADAFKPGEVDCSALGTRKVVFLVGTSSTSPVERSCRISRKVAILFPVINGECSQAEGDGSTDAELRACAAKLADTFTNLHAKLDGKPLKRLKRFRFASPLFTFSPVAGNPIGIPPATNSPSVADGYWVMLKKLKKGTHTLSFGGASPPNNFTTATTYKLTVR